MEKRREKVASGCLGYNVQAKGVRWVWCETNIENESSTALSDGYSRMAMLG